MLHPNDWQSCHLTSFFICYIGETAFAPLALGFLKFFCPIRRFKMDVCYSFGRVFLVASAVCRELPLPAFVPTVQQWRNTLTSVPLKYLSESEHPHCAFCLLTLFPWGSLLLVLIYFNFPFNFISSFHFFFYSFCLYFSEAHGEWVFSFLATCCCLTPYSVCVYVSHFCIFFWQYLPSRAALTFVTSIFPVLECTILLPTQTILVGGGYFLS